MTQAQTLIEEKEDGQARLADHLLALPGGEWALWRCVALRGAGFPAERVLMLSSESCAAATDRLLDAERDAERSREEALAVTSAALDQLKAEGKWDSEKPRRARLLDLMRALKSGKVPAAPKLAQSADSDPEPVAAVEAWRTALALAEAAWDSYAREFAVGVSEASEALGGLASDGLFREAVTWQNRQAVRTCLDHLRGGEAAARDSRRRQHEELAASYLQRYSVKNDTIGFFGPVGWARLDETEGGLRAEAGGGLVAARSVYFEGWCVDALAGVLSGERGLRPWMRPRRLPLVRVEGAMLYHPLAGAHRITAEQATVLRACDGSRNAREIARRLTNSPFSGLKTEAQVFAILEALRSQGVIVWEFEVAFEPRPELRLRRQLEQIEDEALRGGALSRLDELEAARSAVSEAAGDAASLASAMEALEGVFTRLTGGAATRSSGQTYAARTLVYEDCRRDVDVVVGRQVLDHLTPPLELLLTCSRWLTFELAKVYRRVLKQVYDRLARQTGSPVVDAIQFWLQAEPLINNDSVRLTAHLVDEFQARWGRILSIPAGVREVNYRSEDLRERVMEAFYAPGPGWEFARHHSPDVMIAAESAEAIRRGDFQLVMGELHVGKNTIGASLFVAQHPSPEELMRYVELDLPGVKAVPMTPKAWLTSRTNVALISPQDNRIEFERESFVIDRSKAVPIADLVIEERGGDLVVRTRDGRLRYDIIEVFGGTFSGMVMDYFRMLTPAPRTPRVTIDKLIVARETWRFQPDSLHWAQEKDEALRYAAARRWARSEGLPERCFVKVPVETKPFYVDFRSPAYVALLAKAARRTAEAGGGVVAVSEMKPGVGEAWLPDAAGRRYTSELRIVALDLSSPSR